MKHTSLRLKTFELLKNRPASVTLAEVAERANLPITWVRSFHLKGNKNGANVDKVQALYQYLTGKSLL